MSLDQAFDHARKIAMSTSQESISIMELDLEDPWYIKRIGFNANEKQFDIHIDFKSGSKYPCSKCGKNDCSIHDTLKRTWRHSNYFQFKTYIHCRVPRVKCKKCGVKQVNVPWARKVSGFTLLMESLIVLMAKHMTVVAVAEIIDEHDARIRRVLEHYVAES